MKMEILIDVRIAMFLFRAVRFACKVKRFLSIYIGVNTFATKWKMWWIYTPAVILSSQRLTC